MPMWPFRGQSEESSHQPEASVILSSHKLDVSVILMKNEVGGRVSSQFRDSEEVRVGLSSSRPAGRTWPFRPKTEECGDKLNPSVIPTKNEERG